jgi:hypothetical protein
VGVEAENHIGIPVSVDVLQGGVTGPVSVPVWPKRIVVGSTVVASKASVVRMATRSFPLLWGLILFRKLPGLILIETISGITPINSEDKT